MKKTVQDVEVEMESIKKTQIEENLEMKKLGTQAGTRGKSYHQNTRDGRENHRH